MKSIMGFFDEIFAVGVKLTVLCTEVVVDRSPFENSLLNAAPFA